MNEILFISDNGQVFGEALDTLKLAISWIPILISEPLKNQSNFPSQQHLSDIFVIVCMFVVFALNKRTRIRTHEIMNKLDKSTLTSALYRILDALFATTHTC
uniref:Uncharacterized protein n=1 Tax=Glossina pallidipes TaxID=7398 RepID=A0A1A9Z2N5_GLOPL